MRLGKEDARAIDLLLHGASGFAPGADKSQDAPAIAGLTHSPSVGRPAATASDGSTGTMNTMGATDNDNLAARVEHVDALLHLLDHLPADDPPGDLVQRTLLHVQRHAQEHPPRHAAGLGGAASFPGPEIAAHLRHSPGAGREDDAVAG